MIRPTLDADEDFETGGFSSNLPWVTFGRGAHGENPNSEGWTVAAGEAVSGGYAARTGMLTQIQTSELEITLNVTEAGSVSFYSKFLGNMDYGDNLTFSIDGSTVAFSFLQKPWAEASFPVSPGIHNFRWKYTHGIQDATFEDNAWLDAIKFPPHSQEFPPAEAIDLSGTPESGSSITWHWRDVELRERQRSRLSSAT